MKTLSGNKIAGGNPENGSRVEFDYYATNPKAVKMLLEHYTFKGTDILEPCVGGGHVAQAIKDFYTDKNVTCVDIVDRGYPNTIVADYLNWYPRKKFDAIITNPPYKLAKEFIEKSIFLMNDNSQMAMFLKIEFLESRKRREFFEKYPPKYIYVFSDRMSTWNNGNPVDSNGKPWSTVMCHAWFIWEKENGEMSSTEPIIRWL